MPTVNDARVRKANDRPVNPRGEYVLYWPQMARRMRSSHALDYALHLAGQLKKPFVIYEGLKLNYPWANARFHTFLLEGMRDSVAAAAAAGFNYWPFVETPGHTGRGLVRKLAAKACAVVTDDYPAYIVPAQIRALAGSVEVAVHAIDANGVVPLSLLGKQVSAAAHIRPRLHKQFPQCWPFRSNPEPTLPAAAKGTVDPPFKLWEPPADPAAFVAKLPIDQSVPPVADLPGGSVAGEKALRHFVAKKLPRYADERSQPDDPARNAASGLSPYLHYGHLAMDAVVDAVLNADGKWDAAQINPKTRNKDDFFTRDANVNGFLDEAITWRDVGYHWHFCRNADVGLRGAESKNVSWETAGQGPAFNFETMDFTPTDTGTLDQVLPEWAKASLKKHGADRREFEYTPAEWEAGKTHDPLWNAAQTELVKTGRMHNYLRMLWGKKVLEWSPTPEAAYRVLEHLNNKYALDGRDPNSYTGILWCFGLFDRPWPPEREVFGNIRFMSSASTAKKFKLAGYYEYVKGLGKPGGRLF